MKVKNLIKKMDKYEWLIINGSQFSVKDVPKHIKSEEVIKIYIHNFWDCGMIGIKTY